MTDAIKCDGLICNSSQRGTERFAAAKAAEYIQEQAGQDQDHQHWIDEHTTNGTLAEIPQPLGEHDRLRR